MYSDRVNRIIEGLRRVEGGYSENPDDPGGPTRWGVTQRVARRHGWRGDMRHYPWERAREVYLQEYVRDPRFNEVGDLSWPIAEELIDTGVNMGIADAGTFLQRSLTVLNRKGELYPDLKVDGIVGDKTLAALESYLEHRGSEGERVLLKALNCLQGAEYIALAEAGVRFETFVYGWLRARVEV